MIGLQRIGIKTFENENIFQIASPKKKDEYILRNVTGLTGANLNVNYQKTLYSGSVHMGSRREEREITLLFELNPDRSKGSTVESLRNDIYKHIISDELVDAYTRVTLYGSKMDLYTEGRISQIEADLYSQKPMMQISVLCRYAHFMKTVPQPKLEHIVEDDDYDGVAWYIDNPGAPVGFFVQGWSDTEFSRFVVQNQTNGQMLDVTNAPSITGTRWRFDVNTTPEDRMVRKLGLRDQYYWKNVYDNIQLTGGYPQLESGVNKIGAYIIGGTNKKFELTYTQRFHGV